MKIKHLVISGGGPTLFLSLGAYHYLQENNFVNIDDIKSIHGTSAGAIVALMICLKYDCQTIKDYMVNRPWHEAYPLNITSLLTIYNQKGIYDKKAFEICFKSLFDAKNIPLNITLKEFYEFSKIELHMYSFEINNFKVEDISYKTYPNIEVLTALHMTSAIPILFSPVFIEDKCFIDGAVISNYPLNYCIENVLDKNEILGFRNFYNNTLNNKNIIDYKGNLIDYIVKLLYKFIFNMSTEFKQETLQNEIMYEASYLTIDYLKTVLQSSVIRNELYENGIKSAKDFFNKNKIE